ncbi:MAG: YbhB/YbcL family Raf kinase inhibitor-like protein [Desulfobacterales bacterium]|jgi:Raf kinase inhibitor-like YbhB/YbcL family protein|nr:YbhB/YbcL family Raf kinase inhibitor-like protein [Desulfobacterales bacterium]
MFTLKSTAFEDGGVLPEKYAERSMISPPLNWNDVPEGTKSLALAVTDPDVPEQFQFPRVFAHWMVYNISPNETGLPEGASPGGKMPSGAKELNSDFVTFGSPHHKNHYAGPWPPDRSHRYVFTLYALKTALDIPENADYVEFVKTVLPVTITSATLMATYGPAKEPLPAG